MRAPLRGQKTFRPAVIPGFPDYNLPREKSGDKGGHYVSTGLFCPLRSPYTSTLRIYSRISKAPEWVLVDWSGLTVEANPSMKCIYR